MEKIVRGNRYVRLKHDLEFENQDIANAFSAPSF